MHEHHHTHSGGASADHAHTHGAIDPYVLSTARGIRAVKRSFLALFVTAVFQLVVVFFSGSVALLADTIHNFADAATAVPLWFAFTLGRRKPSGRFSYGLGKAEDLAGVAIVVIIFSSAAFACYASAERFFHPQPVAHLWAVVLAGLIGFAGNEAVAVFRIKVGEEIGSAALVADGHHARADGITSLAVLLGALGVWLGYPLADATIGLLITIAILRIVWHSGKEIFTRLLDGVDPEVIEEIKHAAVHVAGVGSVGEVRVRWLGHRMHAELNVAVDQKLSVEQGHEIAKNLRHELLHQLEYLSNATIHIDPANASGEGHHRINDHAHDNLPRHSHS